MQINQNKIIGTKIKILKTKINMDWKTYWNYCILIAILMHTYCKIIAILLQYTNMYSPLDPITEEPEDEELLRLLLLKSPEK